MRGWIKASFTLKRCNIKSLLNMTFQRSKDGMRLLNTNSFRSFHTFRATQTATSIKHGPAKQDFAARKRFEMGRAVFNWMWNISQQLQAKGQSKKRWSLVSIIWSGHKMQDGPDSKCHCLWIMISLLLRRSFMSHQANTRNLGKHFDFQIAFNTRGYGVIPYLYPSPQIVSVTHTHTR
jgi:hypothetical protein